MFELILKVKLNLQRCKANQSAQRGYIDLIVLDEVGDVQNAQAFQLRIGDGDVLDENRRWTMVKFTGDIEDVSFVDMPNGIFGIDPIECNVTRSTDVRSDEENKQENDECVHRI